MHRVTLVIAVVTFLLGSIACGTRGTLSQHEKETLDIVILCSAGFDAGLRAALHGAITEGKVKLDIGGAVDKFVHGYIFENLTEGNRVRAFEIYDKCVARERIARRIPLIDPQFDELRERTQSLWDEYAENRRLRKAIPISDADKYAAMGQSLKFMAAGDLEAKNGVMKTQRQAIMYSIAVEIIVTSPHKTPSESAKALIYAQEAYAAAKATRDLRMDMQRLFPTQYWDWENREHIDYLSIANVSDALIQLIYLRNEPRDRMELEDTLRQLPCDFIQSKKLAAEPMYRRNYSPRRFTECHATRQRLNGPVATDNLASPYPWLACCGVSFSAAVFIF